MSTAIFTIRDNLGQAHTFTGDETTLRLYVGRSHTLSSGESRTFSYHNHLIKPGEVFLTGGMQDFPSPGSTSNLEYFEGGVSTNWSVGNGVVFYTCFNHARSRSLSFRVYIYSRT